MKTTKSPRALVIHAWRTAQDCLPRYSHRFSPQTFTQHQLFACLVLKDFYALTYRGTVGMLRDCTSLTKAIELRKVPHYTTLQKAADRLLVAPWFGRLLSATVNRAQKAKILRRRPRLVAMDSSGFESRHTSRYYAKRRETSGKHGRKRRVVCTRYPKLAIVADTRSHCILAARSGQGPKPDHGDFVPLICETCDRVRPKAVAADAGYDSEGNHRWARDDLHVQSLIPATQGRPGQGEPTGRYRRQMKRHLSQSRYSQRWQAETVVSMLKRLCGEVVHACTYWRRCRLLLLKTLTHNITLLARWIAFLLSSCVPVSTPTISYLGGEKVMPGYNMMGVCKAALEHSVRYLAWDLGRAKKIRVNAISAGPMRTLSSAGIADFDQMQDHCARKSCLERNVEFEELGTSALYLLSHLSSGLTGETIHIDCGYSIVGL